MECTAVFSGWSAGKGKDGVGGGPSTLSDGCGRTNWCSCQCKWVYSMYVLKLNLYFKLLNSAAFKLRMMMRLLPSNNNFKFKDQIWFIQENKWYVNQWTGCRVQFWASLWSLRGYISGCLPQLAGGMTGWVGASLPLVQWLLGLGSSSRHCKGKQPGWLSMAARCCSEMG